MEKCDLSASSFLIPFRYDSPERLRNIKAVISYLTKHLSGMEILIHEEGNERYLLDSDVVHPEIKYTFNHNSSPLMHRTKNLLP